MQAQLVAARWLAVGFARLSNGRLLPFTNCNRVVSGNRSTKNTQARPSKTREGDRYRTQTSETTCRTGLPGPCSGRSQINCAIVNALGKPSVEPSIQTTMASSHDLREQNRVPTDKRNEGASLPQTRIFGREMGTGGLPRENHGGRSALQGNRPSASGAKENTVPQCPARGSKIPVLVKPHRAKPPANFTKLHQNWEANFQKGKALKKKPCTQPMPFNLTQKGAKTTVVMETDLRRQAKGALDSNTVLPLSRVQKTPDKDKTVHDLTRNPVQPNHEAHETLLATNAAHSEQPVRIIAASPDEAVATHSNAARRVAVAFHTNPAGMEQNGLSQHNQPQSIPFRLDQLPHVALETTINRNKAALAPHTPTHSRNQPPRATVEPRGGIEPCFPRDHKSSARCSQDVIPGLGEAAEGSRGQPSASDAPKPLEHNSLDSAVPDSGDQNTSLKQRPSPTHPAPPPQKAGAAVKDGEASVEDFVPDPAALASILQNLGLKPGGAAPSGSASRAPTLGRGSLYLPQRVTMSVRAKGFDRHMTPGQANQNSHRTSVWTPQRVLDTRPQSTRKLSSMQRPCAFRGTPVQTPSQQRMAWMNAVTNKLRNTNGSPCMEHVAMRLFEKPEEGDGQLDTQVNRDRDRDEVGMGEAAEGSRGQPSASDAPKPLEHNSLDSAVPDSGDQNTSLKQRPSPTHLAPPPQKPGAAVKDGEASVEDFVPDPAALASILQNLGLKPGGAAPSGSASRAPTLGRGSLYLPQRVTMSVRAKGFDRHMTPGQANQNSHRTSVWTPQRVRDTRPQSTRKLSSMQRPCGFRGTPVQTPSQQRMAWMNAVTNKLRNTNGSPCMEHVAMRLFEKPEEGDGPLDTQVNRDRDKGQEEKGASRPPQERERETAAPAFFQSVNRESVIVFSQGRRVCRQVETQESGQASQASNGALSSAPFRSIPAGDSPSKLVPCPSTFSETKSTPSTLSSSALRPEQALSCHSALSGRLATSQKEATGGPVGVRWKIPAAAAPPCGSLMKQRLLVQRMQDILLDEECAFYTSRTQDQHRTAPLCRDLLNPLARTFHLQEALHFVPILQAELPAALSSAS
ncbi:uncharacterized protein LOC117401012 isoform X2 [Acipenser ruthenus]|uniref:uncharacterized protein LOC117401012 isoform X2 n=1 Tax=Acipenser ruthenus TaxID=7906 RepID=UPI002740A193|nr:uncharacterized protein LOC117401012 isoform X2 [Acipenser ruthenus]